jgi:hypothetical protein
VTTVFTMRIRPLETNPLELEADPPHVEAGEPVRLSARGARLGEAVVWLPGGERAREILVRPETSTRYVAVDSLPGACPRRGSIRVDVTERPPQAPGAGFFTVAPCRLLDTRDTAEPLAAGDLRLVEVGSRCGIPLGARALSVNLTAVDGTRFGTLVVDADAEARASCRSPPTAPEPGLTAR